MSSLRHAWEDEKYLREHLQAKLTKSETARKLQESLLKNGTAIAREIIRLVGLVMPIHRIAEMHGEGGVSQI